MSTARIAIIGDVHAQIGRAAAGLNRAEQETGRKIDQVFSVGDFGLFLQPEDWEFLTGPKKYRRPESSPRIRDAWSKWRWPVAMIAGNHEPFHKLRDWHPEYFGPRLTYTDAGEISHNIPGLRVVGLSGIHHPEELEFIVGSERYQYGVPKPATWPELVCEVSRGRTSRKRLTYYKQHEIDLLLSFPERPHILLTHDWPVTPPEITDFQARPEGILVERLKPEYVFCGHHHRPFRTRLEETEMVALNILSAFESADTTADGWLQCLDWDGEALQLVSSEDLSIH